MLRSRRLVVFVGVVLAGALLQAFAGPGGIAGFLGVSAASYFLTLLVLAVVAALFAPSAGSVADHHEANGSRLGGSSEFLCDTRDDGGRDHSAGSGPSWGTARAGAGGHPGRVGV